MNKSKSIQVLNRIVSDYVNDLSKQGHTVAAELVTAQANAALNVISVGESDTPVPDANVPN